MANQDHRELRLTLRTLLAWLDDQLSAADVRQIGQKASESEVAQGLIARIQKVTRRRRLTVPNAGPEGTDPNVVASYLDNQLAPEKVAEYEEKCLRSDVDLAEVASCHQILSMISQRAKVPPAAKFRMYRLIKGREAIGREPGQAFAPAPQEPAAKPIPHWAPPGGERRRSALERFGPAAAAVALMLLMGVSAWMMIPDPAELAPRATASPAAEAEANIDPDRLMVLRRNEDLKGVGPAAGGAGLLGPEASARPGAAEDAGDEAEGADAADAAAPEGPGGTESPRPAELGEVADLGEGVLLRWNPEGRSWEAVEEGRAVELDDQLVAPAPFRPSLQLGTTRVRLVGPAAIRVLEPSGDEAARLALDGGRVVLDDASGARVAVVLDGQAVQLNLPAATAVGAARLENWPPGAESPSASSLAVVAPSGRVGLVAGAVEETLAGPGSVVFRVPSRFTDAVSGGVPPWVTSEAPPDADLLAGQALVSYFDPKVSTTRALLEAAEDEAPAVRQLAISTLGALGAVDLVAAAMTRAGDPMTRLAAIHSLRSYGARSPVAARDLRQGLAEFNGEPWADLVFRLLSGFSTEEAGQLETYIELVGLLEHPDVGVRTLALDRLMLLTGRDSLQYDPDSPTGPGLEAWRALMRSGEIHPRQELEGEPTEDEATAPPTQPPDGQPPAPPASTPRGERVPPAGARERGRSN